MKGSAAVCGSGCPPGCGSGAQQSSLWIWQGQPCLWGSLVPGQGVKRGCVTQILLPMTRKAGAVPHPGRCQVPSPSTCLRGLQAGPELAACLPPPSSGARREGRKSLVTNSEEIKRGCQAEAVQALSVCVTGVQVAQLCGLENRAVETRETFRGEDTSHLQALSQHFTHVLTVSLLL